MSDKVTFVIHVRLSKDKAQQIMRSAFFGELSPVEYFSKALYKGSKKLNAQEVKG